MGAICTKEEIISLNLKRSRKGGGVMAKPYIYNLSTHMLHIRGYCCHTNEKTKDDETYKSFDSEHDVVAYDGRSVSMCKKCMQKREKIIRNQK